MMNVLYTINSSQKTVKQIEVIPFVPNAPFLYPLKTENRKVFCYFHDDDDNDNDDEHFYSLRSRFYKVMYNRLFTPLTHFNECINILKIDTSDAKINCY